MNRAYRYFLRDGLRKAISFLLAVMLYFAISSRITKTRDMKNVPVSITLADGLSGDVDNVKVKVTVKGAESAIAAIAPEDLAAHVEVNQNHLVSGNTYSVQLKSDMFKRNSGISIIASDKITLNLKRVISRMIPVEVRYSGNLNRDYIIASTTAVPAAVTVTGPEDVVQSRRSVATAEVPLSEQLFDPFDFYSRIAPVRGVRIEPEQVLIQTVVAKKYEEREIKGVPVLLAGSGNPKYTVTFAESTPKVDIIVSGSPSDLAQITPGRLKPFVDVSRVNSPSILVLPVECSSGVNGVSVKSTVPGEVAVKVRKQK